jgi:LuxR family maltose regulon positive regulatory protein
MDSPIPLLDTKLHVPTPRRRLVARERLTERLDRGSQGKLTLVSAPPGFGKTTLVAEWASGVAGRRDVSVAWLSLDASDADPATFWTYVIAALRTAAPESDVGATALTLLRSAQPSPDAVLVALLNDLSRLPRDLVLALDDYHAIDGPPISAGMSFLLDHLSRRVHVVIAGRADPALPLARLRARGDLTEIRAADLRFTPDEAAAYLTEVMDLALPPPDVAALETRTEGWIGALQLAALSLQGRPDAGPFIGAFAGDDRHIVDYLVEEVLRRQPEDVRRFLLETAVLDRLSGSLCDAVTGRDDGQATLEALERANLFLVPLDDRRQWFRYHQLFADVLQVRLRDEAPGLVPELHRRASGWFEANDDLPAAIRASLAAGDAERTANLIERAYPVLRQRREEAALLAWLRTLPDEIVRVRPVLSAAYAGALLVNGIVDAAEARLDDAESWISAGHGAERPVIADPAQFATLPAEIAVFRTALAQFRGDAPGAIRNAELAFELAPEDDHLRRGAAAGLLGLVWWTLGDLAAAERWWDESRSRLLRAGHVSDALGCAIALADIRTAQGRLGDAIAVLEDGLAVATDAVGGLLRGAADMHVGLAERLLDRNEIAGAEEHLAAATDLGPGLDLPQNPYRSRVAAARLRVARGDIDDALRLLAEAERLYVGDYFPPVRPIHAMIARVRVMQGRLEDGRRWAAEHGLSSADDPTYLREYEHITLARFLLAGGETGEPTLPAFVDRLLQAAERGGRGRSVIELLVLEARARAAAGDRGRALASLERALSLAAPEGDVRVFLDEGQGIVGLLQSAARRESTAGLASRLLATLAGRDVARGPAPVQPMLVEPLSDRELEVLRLLASDLSGPEIAAELVVSVNTLRTHTKNIYAKLGVNSRRAAVRRAIEVGLLSGAAAR